MRWKNQNIVTMNSSCSCPNPDKFAVVVRYCASHSFRSALRGRENMERKMDRYSRYMIRSVRLHYPMANVFLLILRTVGDLQRSLTVDRAQYVYGNTFEWTHWVSELGFDARLRMLSLPALMLTLMLKFDSVLMIYGLTSIELVMSLSHMILCFLWFEGNHQCFERNLCTNLHKPKLFMKFLTFYSLSFKLSVTLAKKKLFQNECHFTFSIQL